MNCKKTWTSKRLLEVIDFNPKETLRKGQRAKKIAMEQLRPFSKTPMGYCEEFYNGGAKFKNGDTLLARITPCLENGKTAQVNELDEGEVGFGSTEYIVLRAKEGKSDKDFIYYLSISPNFRSIAIKSMVGSSGRQRVQQNVLENAEFLLPDLKTQKKISAVLGSLDNKIELNEKINQNLDWDDYFSICRKIIKLEKENQNLEAQAQAIFKSWFVDFEPFGGKMPAGWGQGCLSDVLSVIESGSRPKGGSESSGVPSIGAENIDGIGHYDYSKEKYINRDFFQNLRHGKVNSGDILLYKDGAYVGKVSMALNGFPHEICAVNEHVFILRTNERLPSQSYLYLFLAQHSIRNKIATLGSAKAAQPGVNQSDIKGIALTIPNKRTIQAFENIASSLFSKIVQNSIQSRRLSQLRDTLLPKLMSGEIDVSDVAV